jgi:hypothetical protein
MGLARSYEHHPLLSRNCGLTSATGTLTERRHDVYIKGDGRLVRTQIYVTERQRDELARISCTSGKKQSELIREAVDVLIEHSASSRQKEALRRAAGIWKDRTDLPDFRALREEWDRA